MDKHQLKEYIKALPTINTHSHHLPDEFHRNLTLTGLLNNSYISWRGIELADNAKSRENFLDKVRADSYFVWLEKSLEEIYKFEEEISVLNWDEISERITSAHQDSGWHLEILKGNCNYIKIFLDAYWNAGSDNNHPEIFSPAFRIDTFLFGFREDEKDHNGISFNNRFNVRFNDIDAYVAFIDNIIAEKVSGNCVALKSAIAYDRGIDFTKTKKERAQSVFNKEPSGLEQADIKAFQDYIFFEICNIAAKYNVPVQVHTGLGRLEKSNPMQLQEIIRECPDTKFVLFHGGFPWIHEISGLLHVYKNVYADLCWLPLISPTAAKIALSEYLEVTTSDRIFWGCDTLTSEESYGARLAAIELFSDVFSEKVNNGYMTWDTAADVINKILYENPIKLYGISRI